MSIKLDHSGEVYIVTDSDGDEVATYGTFDEAKDGIRDELSFDSHHQRDLGSLSVMKRLDNSRLPFSGYGIKTEPYVDHRSLALSRCHHISLDDIASSPWGDDDAVYDADGGSQYLVLTDDEAHARAMDSCRGSAWAFNSSFLDYYLPPGGAEAVEALVGQQCEGANEAILALLGDKANVAFEEAIDTDGRGHFLSHYDGCESDYTIAGTTYYIFRAN